MSENLKGNSFKDNGKEKAKLRLQEQRIWVRNVYKRFFMLIRNDIRPANEKWLDEPTGNCPPTRWSFYKSNKTMFVNQTTKHKPTGYLSLSHLVSSTNHISLCLIVSKMSSSQVSMTCRPHMYTSNLVSSDLPFIAVCPSLSWHSLTLLISPPSTVVLTY